MADSVRWRLVTALRDRLDTISIANGYDIDLATPVKMGRLYFNTDTPRPFVSVVENKAEHQKNKEAGRPSRSVPIGFHEIEFVVQGFSNNDITSDGEASYQLLAEIQKCLRPQQSKPGAMTPALQVFVSPGVVRPPDETSKVWYSVTLVTAQIKETGDPYE